VTAFGPIIALFRPYTLGLIDFKAVLLLLQQCWKYKVVPVLAYLPHLGTAVRPNGKSSHVSGNSMDHFQVVINLCTH
jgi:hypothetical protein